MSGHVVSNPYPYKPIPGSGQHNVALTGAAKLTVPNGAIYAVVQANGAPVKYTMDGTTPTASIGMTLAAGATLTLSAFTLISAFQAISSGGTLDVEYYQ